MIASRLQPTEEDKLGFITADISRLLRKVLERRVHHVGLPRLHWLLMANLDRRPGSSVKMLAECLQQTDDTIVDLAEAMEKEGWLMRKDGGYYLTPQGINLNDVIKEPAQKLMAQCFHGIPPERREAFFRDLDHIKANLLWLATDDDGVTPTARQHEA